jgi:hypothetical protein
MPLFQTYDTSCDGEVGEQFEADSYEEAMSIVLEGMGYKIIEIKEEKQ